MNKISFFYSRKVKEFLDIDPYNTRIYTIGLGSTTNLAFLEYLARNTRGFSQRCFDSSQFTWDLTHFLDSIQRPFATFDDKNSLQFIYENEETTFTKSKRKKTEKDKDKSQVSFPFPIPDLYLDRPLVMKYYNNNGNRLKGVIINGTYLKMIDSRSSGKKLAMVTENGYGYIQGNQVYDNDEFPLEMLLANEELNYWLGDYWFKRENWMLKNEIQNDGKIIENPFLLFGSVDKHKAEQIIGDLSDQTGIASIFRYMVSFSMTPEKYDEYTRELESNKEVSRMEISRLAEKTTQKSALQNTNKKKKKQHENENRNQLQLQIATHNKQKQSLESLPSASYDVDYDSYDDENNNNNDKNDKKDSDDSTWSTQQLTNIRKRQNKHARKNNANRVAAVSAIAILGTIAVAVLISPFDGKDNGRGGGGSNGANGGAGGGGNTFGSGGGSGGGGGGGDFFDFDDDGGDGCECEGCEECDGCEVNCDDECCVVM